jgi:hypothetical protein
MIFTWRDDAEQPVVQQTQLNWDHNMRKYDLVKIKSFQKIEQFNRKIPKDILGDSNYPTGDDTKDRTFLLEAIQKEDGGIWQDLNDMLRNTIDEQADLFL